MKGHKKDHHKGHEKRAEGGKINEYNAQGSPEAGEAKDEKAEFKRGGKAKHEHKKHGGHVHGTKGAKRLDKRARGGRMGGESPYSSAMHESMPEKSGASDAGHEGEQPKDEMKRGGRMHHHEKRAEGGRL